MLAPDRGEEPDWDDARAVGLDELQRLVDGLPARLFGARGRAPRVRSQRRAVFALAEETIGLGPFAARQLAVVGVLVGIRLKLTRIRKGRQPEAMTVGEVLLREANTYAQMQRRTRRRKRVALDRAERETLQLLIASRHVSGAVQLIGVSKTTLLAAAAGSGIRRASAEVTAPS